MVNVAVKSGHENSREHDRGEVQEHKVVVINDFREIAVLCLQPTFQIVPAKQGKKSDYSTHNPARQNNTCFENKMYHSFFGSKFHKQSDKQSLVN
jgi:hypothetical protein